MKPNNKTAAYFRSTGTIQSKNKTRLFFDHDVRRLFQLTARHQSTNSKFLGLKDSRVVEKECGR